MYSGSCLHLFPDNFGTLLHIFKTKNANEVTDWNKVFLYWQSYNYKFSCKEIE
jgi:hypothetical protein